jgi:hypothetical protein
VSESQSFRTYNSLCVFCDVACMMTRRVSFLSHAIASSLFCSRFLCQSCRWFGLEFSGQASGTRYRVPVLLILLPVLTRTTPSHRYCVPVAKRRSPLRSSVRDFYASRADGSVWKCGEASGTARYYTGNSASYLLRDSGRNRNFRLHGTVTRTFFLRVLLGCRFN